LETDHVFVVNKPTGISHANSDNELGILNVLRRQQEQGLLASLASSSSSSNYTGRLYGVHRLDRVTSGILVLAKDAPTARRLTAAFREGLVTKYYTGISRHKPSAKKQGWVTGGMVRGRRKSWQLTREESKSKNDRDSNESIPNYARTRFFTAGLGGLSDALVQDEDEGQSQVQPKTLLLFRPYTGRTHQLRVAAKSVGLALAGDPVYSDGGEQPDTTTTATTPRTYLHATGFHLPGSEEDGTQDITIWSPPPFDHLWNESGQGDFQAILNKLVHKHCDCPAILKMLE
jgi:tRNA pseudouridine32 synthase/23S rRNA pseudouridine746 synthase